ncbi:MAG: glycoside hydrolase family 16 protein [Bacilli bacterium]|nr:glycoside hydrolase family 16 protein [Bacilli bacterium]
MKKSLSFLPLCLSLVGCALPVSSTSSAASTASSNAPAAASSQLVPSSKEGGLSTDASSDSADVLGRDFHPEGYSLSWSDEFEGTALSKANWDYEIGNNNGWGNNEPEYYTDHNETVGDGLLSIHAKKEETTVRIREQDVTFPYTSSRLVTRHKKYFTYGYMCARIRLPVGDGMWPAFWMMPETNYGTQGHTWWPTCGEIDIMEAKGRFPEIAAGAIHYSSNGTGGQHAFNARECNSFGRIDDFHVYAVEWTQESITWIYDGTPFFSLHRSIWNGGYGTGDAAPFNRDFYFILNLAVGGNYDGGRLPPDDFQEATMDVDYVRCYQKD